MSRFYTSVATYGNSILLRGYENGRAIKQSIDYKPYLFMNSPTADGTYRTVFGVPVGRVNFDSMKEARDFVKRYDKVDNVSIYGMNRFIYPFIFDRYPGQIEFDQDKIRIANIDIEVASDKGFPNISEAMHEITAITIKLGDLFYAFGCGEFTTEDKNISYFRCANEKELLCEFIMCWKAIAPDVVTGWNIEGFDIPYLVNRITNVCGEREAKNISPWRILRERTIESRGKQQTVYSPVGLAVLDYLALYKKFTFNQQESYSLNNIASVELGETKTDYSEYGSLNSLYRGEYKVKDLSAPHKDKSDVYRYARLRDLLKLRACSTRSGRDH